jgi:hypothetical protein
VHQVSLYTCILQDSYLSSFGCAECTKKTIKQICKFGYSGMRRNRTKQDSRLNVFSSAEFENSAGTEEL